MPWFRAAAVWALLAILMIAQGWVREQWLVPRMGELAAHQASSLSACGILLLTAFWTLRWLGCLHAARRQLAVGALWLGLTVAFEFGFGHFVAGHSWARLLADYDLLAGRLWVLVLLTTFTAPRIAGWLRERLR